jgi:outer membrane lipoprotein SlyB
MFNNKYLVVCIMVAFSFCTFYGCASSQSASVYSRNTARKAHRVEQGIIEHVKPVKIEGTKSKAGAGIGAISGGILGNTIGDGSGKTIATLFGVLIGGAAGAATEEKLTKVSAFEIVIKKDNGQQIVIVQENDNYLTVGDRVNIISANDGTVRASKIHTKISK